VTPKGLINHPPRYGIVPPEQVMAAFDRLRGAADKYITEEGLDWPGYIFHGPPGVGKTGVAIQLALIFADHGRYARFDILWDIVSAVKATWGDYSERSERDAIASYIKPAMLVVDDAGVQFGSESERNILYRILVGRYNECKPTIITTNCDLNKDSGRKLFVQSVGDRVVDRFQDWVVDGAEFGPNLRRKS
jgi:DNA replication protein DnaC